MSIIGITPEMILQLQKELEHHQEQARAHERKARAVEQMLRGAEVVAPDAFEAAHREGMVAPAQEVAEDHGLTRLTGKKPTMPEAISQILGQSGRGGMTKLGLRERLAEEYPEIRLGENYVYFYKTMRRLETNGRVKKRGKILKLCE